jgi:hypothetical protein
MPGTAERAGPAHPPQDEQRDEREPERADVQPDEVRT